MAAISLEEIITQPFVKVMLNFIETTPEDKHESHLTDLLGTKILHSLKEMMKTVIKAKEDLTFKELLKAFETKLQGKYMMEGFLQHLAATYGYADIAISLIEKGAAIDATDSYGRAALYYAAMFSNIETAIALIKKGATLDITADYASHLLTNAVIEGDTEATKNLIEKGVTIDGIEVAPYDKTLLHTAAYLGHTDIAIFLIEKGAAIDATDSKGRTALTIALEGRETDTAIALIKKGATIDVTGSLARWAFEEVASFKHIDLDAHFIERIPDDSALLKRGLSLRWLAFVLQLKNAATAKNNINRQTPYQRIETKFNGFIEHCRKASKHTVSGLSPLTFLCHAAINNHEINIEGQPPMLVSPGLTIEESVLYHMKCRKVTQPNVHSIDEIIEYFDSWEPEQAPEASSSESTAPRVG